MKDEFLKKLLDYLQNIEVFAAEELPDIVRQALRYETVTAYVNSALMIFLMGICIFVGIYFLFKPKSDGFPDDFFTFFVPTLSAVGVIIFFCQLCIQIDKLIKIYVAPKYFLIDLIKGLAK